MTLEARHSRQSYVLGFASLFYFLFPLITNRSTLSEGSVQKLQESSAIVSGLNGAGAEIGSRIILLDL
jgi:hypothetical protein